MFAKTPKLKQIFQTGLFGLVIVSVSACSAIYRNHGYTPTDAELAEVVVGVDTRDTVSESVGPPSSSGVLDDSGFYYVATRIRHYGAREPEIVARELVAISFDSAGVVRNIERFGLQDGQVIPLSRRVTSSGVQDKTFIRQLLGNLGRFNPTSALE